MGDPFEDVNDLLESGDNREAVRAYGLAHAKRRGIDPGFADRLWTRESGYNRHALNKETGAAGIGQMIPGTQKRFGVKDPHDAREGIDKSLDYLEELHNKFNGDPRRMAAGYFAGEGQSDRALANPKGNPKTAAYANAVGGADDGQDDDPFADIRDLLEKGNVTHHASQKPAAPAFTEDPEAERQFELYKKAGRLDVAKEYGDRLRAKGYEVGEDEDGNPYQKRPSAAPAAPAPVDRVLSPQRHVRGPKRSTLAQQFHGNPLQFWEEGRSNQDEMQRIAREKDAGRVVEGSYSPVEGGVTPDKLPALGTRPGVYDARGKLREAGSEQVDPRARVAHSTAAPLLNLAALPFGVAGRAAQTDTPEQTLLKQQIDALVSKKAASDTINQEVGRDYTPEERNAFEVILPQLEARLEEANRRQDVEQPNFMNRRANDIKALAKSESERGLKPGVTKHVYEGAVGMAPVIAASAAFPAAAPLLMGAQTAAENYAEGVAPTTSAGRGAISAGSVYAMGGAAGALDKTPLGSLSKLAGRTIANTGIGLGAQALEGGSVVPQTPEERTAFYGQRIFDVAFALMHSSQGHGLTEEQAVERAHRQVVKEAKELPSFRVRHDVFGEGTVSPDQRRVANGHLRINFADGKEKIILYTEKNSKLHFLPARTAAPDTQQGTAPLTESERPSARFKTPDEVLDHLDTLDDAAYQKFNEARAADPAYIQAMDAYFAAPTADSAMSTQALLEFGNRYFGTETQAADTVPTGETPLRAGTVAVEPQPPVDIERRTGERRTGAGAPPPEGERRGLFRRMRDRVSDIISPENAERRETAEREANVDELTGEGNQRAWLKARKAAEEDPSLSIIKSDINNLKGKNHFFGDDAGDEAIIRQARSLRKASEEIVGYARVMRSGKGDEVVAVVPKEHAEAVSRRAEELFGEDPLPNGMTVSLSADHGDTFEGARLGLEARKTTRKGPGGSFRPYGEENPQIIAAEKTIADKENLIADWQARNVPEAQKQAVITGAEKAIADQRKVIEGLRAGAAEPVVEEEPAEPHHSEVQNRDESGQFSGGFPPEVHADRRQSVYDRLVGAARERTPEEEAALYQASDLSVDEFRAVSKKADALKKQAKAEGRPLDVVLDEYLRQKSLFGEGEHEMSPQQQEVLEGMVGARRRRGPAGEQGGLFEGGIEPTLESKQAEAEQRRFNEPQGSLFQAAETPEAHEAMSEVVAEFLREGVRDFREAAQKFRAEFGPADEYAKIFEQAWDREKGVKKRGKMTYERALELADAVPQSSLLTAIRRHGGISPDESDIAMHFSNTEGGAGLVRKGGLSVERMIEKLREDGFILPGYGPWGLDTSREAFDRSAVNPVDSLSEAMHAASEGRHPGTYDDVEKAAQAEWDRAGREDFAENSEHAVMSRAFDNAKSPEYKEWVDAYDTAINPKGKPTDDDVNFFKEASRELGLSDETINRLLSDADERRREEAVRIESSQRQAASGTTVPRDAASFQDALVEHWKIPEAAAEATSHVVDAFANTWAKLTGGKSEDFFGRFRIGAGQPGMEQGSRAATTFLQDGTAVISALRNPNESSAAHEVQHVASGFFMNLSEELRNAGLVLSHEQKQFIRDMDSMAKWMGLKSVAEFNELHNRYVESGKVSDRYREAQEKSARGFERYLLEGKAPTPQLEAVFARFKQWLSDIYFSIAGSPIDVDIPWTQRAVWDRLLGGEGDQNPQVTGIKNAVTVAERERRGQKEIEGALRKSFEKSLDDGIAFVENDADFRGMTAFWAKNPTVLSDTEEAALAYDRMRLYNEHRKTLKQLEEANNEGDQNEIDRLNLSLTKTEEAINTNDEAARRTGTEGGRSLNARKLMINQDYSLASMLQRARAAEGKKELSPELRKRVEELHKRIASADAELELARQRISELESQNARQEKVQNWGKAVNKGKPRPKTAVTADMEALKAQFAELARKARGLMQDDSALHQADPVDESLMPKELQKLVKQMARLSVEAGARTAEEVNEQVHSMVSEHFPEITPRETADIWSEYGKKAVLSKDEIDVALREAKRQSRLLSGLEDALAGEPPQRSGLQRDKPSQRVRALMRDVTQAIRKMGLKPERKVDPEEQWKTSQEAVRTRLRNHIEDLDHQIETGERPVAAPKLQKAYDDETIALMAERDILKRQVEDPTQKNKESLQTRLAETERKLAEKDFGRSDKNTFPPEIYDDAESTQLRTQLKDAQRKLQAARREPQVQDALRNQISDLQRRIREGDFSRAAKEPVPVSPAVEALRAQRNELSKTLRELEGPREATYEQKVKAAEAGVERSIADLDERIKRGNLEAKKRTSSVWSANLGKLKLQREALSNTLKDMRKAAREARDPQIAKLKNYKKAVEKSIAEYERRLAEGDFTTKQRSTLTLDPAAEALVAKRDALKNKYQAELQKQKPGKWYRNIGGLRKAWMLSGPTTQLRNVGGTGLYQVFDEAARVPAAMTDVLASAVTGQRSVTLSPIKTLDAVINGLVKQGLKEAGETLKHGATKEQMEQHQFFHEIDTGLKVVDVASNAVFRFMSASDRVFNRYSFQRNLVDRATVQAKNEARLDKGLDVQQRAKDLVERALAKDESGKPRSLEPELKAAAEHDALVATFNNSNSLSTAMKSFKGRLSPGQLFALELVMPFDRTPTNVVMRVLESTPLGYLKAAGKVAGAAKRGVKGALENRRAEPDQRQTAREIIQQAMTVEQQRDFSRSVGKATAGSMLMALGYYLASKGMLTGAGTDEDRRKGIEPNTLTWHGHQLNLSPVSPLGNILALGASTYQWTHRGQYEPSQLIEAALNPLTDQPLLRAGGQVSKLATNFRTEGAKQGASMAFSFVPFSGMVRDIGKAHSFVTGHGEPKAATSLDRQGLKEQFQKNVPVWRNLLPPKTPKGRGALVPLRPSK